MKSIATAFRLIAALGAISLAGCSLTGGYQSAKYRMPEGSTVELMQRLQLPPNAARVFIQDGVAMRGNDVNRWSPYCSFGLDRTRDGKPLAREIEPARFRTGKMQIGVHASLEPGHDEQLAFNGALSGLDLANSGNGGISAGTPWPYTYFTSIELYSEDAPQVDDLTCSFDGGPVDRNLTVDEIRSTLGDLVRIY